VPAPAGAQGKWSVVSSTLGATAAIITDPTAYNSTVTGVAAGETLVLQWAIGNGVCDSTRDQMTLFNRKAITNTGIEQDTVVCSNVTPNMLRGLPATEGGPDPLTYQWQYSTDNVTFVNIPGANGQHYQPPVMTQTLYFKRLVSNNICAGESNVVTIAVSPRPNVTVTPPAAVCTDVASFTLPYSTTAGGNLVSYSLSSSDMTGFTAVNNAALSANAGNISITLPTP
ncbi:hypothetical protein ACWKWU_22785, partial [Chitinophaga lutea]